MLNTATTMLRGRIYAMLQSLLAFLLPMTNPILRSDDHHLLRYYAAIHRVVQPVMQKTFELLRANNGKTIREQLFDLPSYSMTIYKKTFNEDERQKLDSNMCSQGFDVSLLFKLLQLICNLANRNDIIWSTNGTLENSLRCLKNHRNMFAHESLSLTFVELRDKVKDLRRFCKSILELVGIRESKDMFSDIRDMEKGMEDALTGGIDLWEPYREAMEELRSQQSSILIREGREDVMKLGKQLKILNPFAWLLDDNFTHLEVEHIFTEVDIEGQDSIAMHEILITELTSGEFPDSIVITGTPGIGKSSLFRFLVHDWLSARHSMRGMENVDLVIPVELRHVVSCNVKDLIKDEILFYVSRELMSDDVFSALQNVSVLWMLDGYDEANVTTRSVVKEICRKFPNSRVMITTRPEFRNDLEKSLDELGLSRTILVLNGFSKGNMKICVEKLINASVIDDNERVVQLNGFLSFVQNENRHSWDIFKVPLFVTIVLVLWLNCSDKLEFIRTRTELYNALLEHIINKLIVRESYKRLGEDKCELKDKIWKFLDGLGKVLWKKQYETTLKKYEVEILRNKCTCLGLPFKETMSAFFVMSEKATLRGIEEEYTILHKTLKEYLCARAFTHEMISKNQDIFTTEEKWLRSARETVLSHEPNSQELFHLPSTQKLDNLKKDMPHIYRTNFKETHFPSNQLLYGFQDCCICDDRKTHWIRVDDNTMTNETNNYWCYLRDQMRGMWTIFLVGYMNMKSMLTETVCEQLAFIYFHVTHPNQGDYALWNLVLTEANNLQFHEKLFKYIRNIDWGFNKSHGIPEAQELLKYVKPHSLFLHYCKPRLNDPVDIGYNNLINSIELIKDFPTDIILDLRNLLPSVQTPLRFITRCLETLLEEKCDNRLVTLRCPVDDSHINILKKATNLRELSVRFHGQDFAQLTELMRILPSLKLVNIVLDLSLSYRSQHIPDLSKKRINTRTCVLQNVFSLPPQSVAYFLQRLPFHPSLVFVQGIVTHIDLELILAYTFWILESFRNIKRLYFIVDCQDDMIYSITNKRELKKLYMFVQKYYSKNVRYIFLSKGAYPSQKRNSISFSHVFMMSSRFLMKYASRIENFEKIPYAW